MNETKLPRKMIGKAWVGVWNEKQRRLGWAVPNFIDDHGPNLLKEPWAWGEFWRCKVTIELFKDKRGRTRRKIIKAKRW